MKLVDKIQTHLLSCGYDVFGKNYSNKRWYLMVEDTILSIGKEEDVVISFHACCNPCKSSRIILRLTELKDIKSLEVSDVFTYDKDGNYYTGESAIKLVEDKRKELILKEYVHDQMQKHYLLNNKMGEC